MRNNEIFLLKKMMARLILLPQPVVDVYGTVNALLIVLVPKVGDPFSEEVLCAPRILNIEVYFEQQKIKGWLLTKYSEIYQDVIRKTSLLDVPSIDIIESFIDDETIKSIDIANGEDIIHTITLYPHKTILIDQH